MIWINVEKLFLMLLIASPVTLCFISRPIMTRFCLGMVAREKARRLYVRCFLILLLLYHYVYASGHPGEWGILLSTLMCAALFSFGLADRFMYMLDADRGKIIVLTLLALAMYMVPHLHTVAVTSGYLLLARMFYPSSAFIALWEKDERLRTFCMEHPLILPSLYFR